MTDLISMQTSNSSKSHQKIVVFLGENQVGKTALLKSLSKSKFIPTYEETIGVDFHSKVFDLSTNEKITLSLWDTNGKEIKSVFLSNSLYRNASCFVIVISYDNKKSLQTLHDYINFALNFHPKKCPQLVVIVNKQDIRNKEFKLKDVAKEINDYSINICELSAKDIKKVQNVFYKISLQILGIKQKKKALSIRTMTTAESSEYNDYMIISLRNSFRIEDDEYNNENFLLTKSQVGDKKGKCC